MLQPHTVAMTPDDTAFNPPAPSTEVDDFIVNFVQPTVTGSGVPGDCGASYVVPADHPTFGVDFRGGNAFTAQPTHWEANVGTTDVEKCARHQFSLNTCNGCHFGDTATPFFHVDPMVSPAGLSDFLTGGVLGIASVPDTQFGTPSWDFADLDRRFHRLYEIACASCGSSFSLDPSIFDAMLELAGVIPIDPVDPEGISFPVGPISDLETMVQVLDLRTEMVVSEGGVDVELDGFIRPVETFVH